MAQDDTIFMFANFLVLLASIHTPKPTQILPMLVGQSKKVFVWSGSCHIFYCLLGETK
jgi:hypothetical protein